MRMSSILIIISLFALCMVFMGCVRPTSPIEAKDGNNNELIRYQTSEVICFRVDGHGGLWCQWKGE